MTQHKSKGSNWDMTSQKDQNDTEQTLKIIMAQDKSKGSTWDMSSQKDQNDTGPVYTIHS